MIRRERCTAAQWDNLMAGQIQRHILQSVPWAVFKQKTGWQAHFLVWYDEDGRWIGGASVLEKKKILPLIGFPLKIFYVPRGPILNWAEKDHVDAILMDLRNFAREQHGLFIKIDPEVIIELEQQVMFSIPVVGEAIQNHLRQQNWRVATDQIQFRNTFWLDLSPEENQLLAQMKQKTRYNIRLAEKKGVTVRKATPEDFHLLYQMYAETAQRDQFIIREEAYYTDLWLHLMNNQMADGLIAELDGEALAGLVLFVYEGRSWYFYGMSTDKHRNCMPTYLLQWEAMKLSKQLGCTLYDLWGAPDEISEEDSMFGVYRFKQGLGAALVKGIGAWDFVVNPVGYAFYSSILPKILEIMRNKRRADLHQEVKNHESM